MSSGDIDTTISHISDVTDDNDTETDTETDLDHELTENDTWYQAHDIDPTTTANPNTDDISDIYHNTSSHSDHIHAAADTSSTPFELFVLEGWCL